MEPRMEWNNTTAGTSDQDTTLVHDGMTRAPYHTRYTRTPTLQSTARAVIVPIQYSLRPIEFVVGKPCPPHNPGSRATNSMGRREYSLAHWVRSYLYYQLLLLFWDIFLILQLRLFWDGASTLHMYFSHILVILGRLVSWDSLNQSSVV